MVTGMNIKSFKKYTITLITLALLLPAHVWAAHGLVKNYSQEHYENKYSRLLIAQNDRYKQKHNSSDDQFRLKKNRYQKDARNKKENRRRSQMSLKESASSVQGHVKGRILSARPYQKSGRSYHRIKVLTPDGVVRVILVDPETGHMN